MKIKKDSIDRYIVDTKDGGLLYLDINSDKEGALLGIYQGHEHQAINDRLESLDVANWLNENDVDELISLLMKCKEEMRKVEIK